MDAVIKNKLGEIAADKQVEILYACESGSRAWDFASPDSDFDIRFIYKNHPYFYLNLWERKDTIEFMTSDDLDGAGWDLDKALKLLSKSNVPLMEWLHSPVVYFSNDAFLHKMREFSEQCFSPISATWHYLSSAKNHVENCKADEVKLKTYFYALRNALCAKWIVKEQRLPPVSFLELMVHTAPMNIIVKIEDLLELKSKQDEKYLHPNDAELTAYILKTMDEVGLEVNTLPQGNKISDELNIFFLQEIHSHIVFS